MDATAPELTTRAEDEWLWGWDATPGIVSIWAEEDGRASVWRRIPGTGELVREVEQFRPWILLDRLDTPHSEANPVRGVTLEVGEHKGVLQQRAERRPNTRERLLRVRLSIVGAITHDREGNVNRRAVLWVTLGGVPGALAGSLAAVHLPRELLVRLFGVLLLYSAYRIWAGRRPPAARKVD